MLFHALSQNIIRYHSFLVISKKSTVPGGYSLHGLTYRDVMYIYPFPYRSVMGPMMSSPHHDAAISEKVDPVTMSQEGSQVPFHFAVTDLEPEKSYVGETQEGMFFLGGGKPNGFGCKMEGGRREGSHGIRGSGYIFGRNSYLPICTLIP